jgi:hypothetical protein
MQRSQISQLIQMRSIGISDTSSVDSVCHPEEVAHCRPSLFSSVQGRPGAPQSRCHGRQLEK